jgi:aminopeptidase N
MKCPYDSLTLTLESIKLAPKLNKMVEDIGEEVLSKRMEAFAEKHNSINLEDKNKVAEFHSITVSELINSPNYKVLKEEYKEKCTQDVFNELKEQFQFNDKEVWALLFLIQKVE